MLGQDLYLVDEGPETDGVFPHPGRLPLPLTVAEEGAEVAGLAVHTVHTVHCTLYIPDCGLTKLSATSL